MLTPQEVSARSFTKAVMGGYNMTMVDEFLDELTDDYTSLYKENASLKAKLKVLVEKVEEYRATEDSMRATLLTAQRMADSIVKEAEAKRDEILAQAEASARDKLEHYRRELADSDQRLRQGQIELQRFINAGRDLCAKELEFLARLPELEIAPAETGETRGEAEQKMAEEVAAALAKEPEPAPAETAVPDPFAAGETPEAAQPEPETPVVEQGDLDATRRVNLNDLKFGRNYNKEG